MRKVTVTKETPHLGSEGGGCDPADLSPPWEGRRQLPGFNHNQFGARNTFSSCSCAAGALASPQAFRRMRNPQKCSQGESSQTHGCQKGAAEGLLPSLGPSPKLEAPSLGLGPSKQHGPAGPRGSAARPRAGQAAPGFQDSTAGGMEKKKKKEKKKWLRRGLNASQDVFRKLPVDKRLSMFLGGLRGWLWDFTACHRHLAFSSLLLPSKSRL